jgi:hypothetical protein
MILSYPLVCGKYFSVSMTLDATFKGMGRNLSEEICIYEVKDGKTCLNSFIFKLFNPDRLSYLFESFFKMNRFGE